MTDDDDFEFSVPDELFPWIESQRQRELGCLFGGFYILRDFKLVKVSLMEWSAWLSSTDNRIEYTVVGDAAISTVFLGIDHNFCFADLVNHRPILFESMIFGGGMDQFQWRYSTLGEAKQGHYELVAAVREGREPQMSWGEEGFWNWFREMFD